jgi:hypothetical protein
LNNCTVSGNSASWGGGIYNDAELLGVATLTINNSTLSGNSASMYGGGIYNDGRDDGHASLTIGGTILKTGLVGANIFNVDGSVSSQATT